MNCPYSTLAQGGHYPPPRFQVQSILQIIALTYLLKSIAILAKKLKP